ADNGMPLTSRICKNAKIMDSNFTCGLHVTVSKRGHAAAALLARDINFDTVVLQNRHNSLRNLRIIVIGKDIDKVRHRAGAAAGLHPSAPLRPLEKAAARKPRQSAFPGNAK